MKGFTLLEVLLALLIFTAGFVTLSLAISQGLFVSGDSEAQLVATNLGQEKMEEIRNKTYANVSAEAKAAVSGFSPYQREVTVSTPVTNLKQVTVNVYWFNKADELNVSLVTYVSNA